MNPFFSVIIPVYNKEITIVDTIKSVLNQSYSNFELLIIDDGSLDSSSFKVKSIVDSRIRLFTKANGGVSSARNLGIKKSVGNFILFLDADDYWELGFLNEIYLLINKYPSINIFTTGFAYKSGNQVVPSYGPEEEVIEDYFKIAIDYPVVNSSTICINKKILENISLFNENITHGEDLELWARLAKNNKIARSKAIKSFYVKGLENQATNILPNPRKSIVYHLNFECYLNNNELKYYRKIVVTRFFSYLKRGEFRYSFMIFSKYFKYIPFKCYWSYYYYKINNKDER